VFRNPVGVASEGLNCSTLPQTLRGWKPLRALPRIAADGNPGLDDATPSGLELLPTLRKGSCGLQSWAEQNNPHRV